MLTIFNEVIYLNNNKESNNYFNYDLFYFLLSFSIFHFSTLLKVYLMDFTAHVYDFKLRGLILAGSQTYENN